MQGMIRCGLLAGLLIACHTSDSATPDGSTDGGGSDAAGLHVVLASEPATFPGNLEDWLTIESATFAFDNLKVIGDAGPGDTRTTASLFQARFDSSGSPATIDFPDAPPGLYSKVSLQIDGHLITSSFRIKGQVKVNGTFVPYEIEDHNAISLSLDIDRMLQPGGTATINLLVKWHDALAGVDYTTLHFDDNHLELGTNDAQMSTFVSRLTQSFSVDNSGPN